MTSKVTYIGDLRCDAEHLQSGTRITTDAPTDNHGKGEVFSPTDLCATSLAQCMLTTVAILGKSRNLDITGAYAEVLKIMNPSPRKIAEIVCTLHFKADLGDGERTFIEETARQCPVALSLHQDLQQTLTFVYDL